MHSTTKQIQSNNRSINLININRYTTPKAAAAGGLIGFLVFLLIFFFGGNKIIIEFDQREKLERAHIQTREITDQWNKVSNIEQNNELERNISKNIETIIEDYENLEIALFSNATQVVYYWHLAKLKIIEADVLNNSNSAESAIAQLDIATFLMETAVFNPEEQVFLKKNNFMKQLERTRLNALALIYFYTGDLVSKHNADIILAKQGGCNKLYTQGMRHVKRPCK